MLNKKTAFKPKAAIRRPPPASAPQASQRPSPAEPSKTPAPQEPTAPSPPAAEPSPNAPPVSANAPAADIVAPAQARGKDVGKSAAEEAPRSSVSSTATTVVAEGRETAIPAQSKAFKAPVPTLSGTTVAGSANVAAADIPSKAPAVPAATRQPSSTTPTPAPISPTTQPISAARVQVAAPQDQSVEEAVSLTGSATPVQPTPEPVQTPNQQTEAAKPARGRKRATAAATAGDSGEPSTRAPAAKRPRKRAAALPGEEGYQPAAPRATRSRKRDASTTEDGAVEEEGEEGSARPKRKPPPRAQREATPPDAEAVEIDITQVKMADLAKDMHIGKKFSLHNELMERERAKRLRAQERRKRQQNGEEDADDDNTNTPIKEGETPAASSSTDANTSTRPTPAAGTGTEPTTTDPEPSASNRAPIGETYQIIDGEIVLDHRSLQVDRHARAREEAGELVEIEENDFTHHTTTATYLRRNLKPQQWTDDETELFYQALSAFGTDFDTICRMFKSKTRKHIKLKFNREERVNPARINAALVGQKTVSIDMDAYKKATGQEYETAEAIYAEQRKAEEEFEARQKALEDEKAEEVRRKKEEVLAQLNSSVGEEGLKKGGKGRGRKKKQNFVGL